MLKTTVRNIRKINKKCYSNQLFDSLETVDPEMFEIIELEKQRQREGIVLIPSENFTSKAVLEALGSIMSNKYSEGLPGKRYYGGNEFIDKSENLTMKRALEAFNLSENEWGVNVQPLSGSPANMEAYMGLLELNDRILSLDLPHGGHLSHGFQTKQKKISKTSYVYQTMAYRLHPETNLIDYEKMEEIADYFRPNLIVAGTSAYSRNLDYVKFRKVCDQHSAYLLADMSHISGLVAAGVVPSPFEFSDVVTTTTHKSLRGPRHAMIFYRKGSRMVNGKEIKYDIEDRINSSVFPGCQGGPHNHSIAALGVALKMVKSDEFKEYQKQVLVNCQVLCKKFLEKDYDILTGGSDNHLMLINMKNKGLDGSRVEKILDSLKIAVNKNTVPSDTSPFNPSGIRLGTPAITTRGFKEKDCEKTFEFIERAVEITKKMKKETKTIKEFQNFVDANKDDFGLKELREEIIGFSSKFPTIGFEAETMKFK